MNPATGVSVARAGTTRNRTSTGTSATSACSSILTRKIRIGGRTWRVKSPRMFRRALPVDTGKYKLSKLALRGKGMRTSYARTTGATACTAAACAVHRCNGTSTRAYLSALPISIAIAIGNTSTRNLEMVSCHSTAFPSICTTHVHGCTSRDRDRGTSFAESICICICMHKLRTYSLICE